MACNTKYGVEIQEGSVEYLYADIRTNRVLDTQPIELSISPVDAPLVWETAEWVGSPGKFRSARILLDGSLAIDNYWVFARLTDDLEVPIIPVGRLFVV